MSHTPRNLHPLAVTLPLGIKIGHRPEAFTKESADEMKSQVLHRTQNALRGSFPVIGPGSISGLGEKQSKLYHYPCGEARTVKFILP